jgi:hypothetical protein
MIEDDDGIVVAAARVSYNWEDEWYPLSTRSLFCTTMALESLDATRIAVLTGKHDWFSSFSPPEFLNHD